MVAAPAPGGISQAIAAAGRARAEAAVGNAGDGLDPLMSGATELECVMSA